MTITAAQVQELRAMTGEGIMACKKALAESGGDVEKAIENMRKAGHLKASKKATRTAAEGLVSILVADDHKSAVMLEINCETDFVAKDSHFVEYNETALQIALRGQHASVESLLADKAPSGESLDEQRAQLVAKLGENIHVRRLVHKQVQRGRLMSYVHGGRIGVLVHTDGAEDALARDIAMHVAAAAPMVVRPDDVSADVIEKERAIYTAQAEASGKPAEIIEKMIQGRIGKFLDEISLLGQPFVKNPDVTIESLLKDARAEVIAFERYVVGEGIEKQESNFAEEVMAQANRS